MGSQHAVPLFDEALCTSECAGRLHAETLEVSMK